MIFARCAACRGEIYKITTWKHVYPRKDTDHYAIPDEGSILDVS